MKLAIDKIEQINKTYKADFTNREYKNFGDIALNLQTTLDGVHVFNGNWDICSVDEISALIEELENIKCCITFETGVIL